MKRCREFVDGFMEWFTVQRIIEAADFTAMCLAMGIVMWLVFAGWVGLVVAVVTGVGCGALAGAVAMWVIYTGGRDEMEGVYERRDIAIDHAEAIVELHTPPEPMPAIQVTRVEAMRYTAPKAVRTMLLQLASLLSRW